MQIGSAVKSIGYEAFKDCISLEAVSIPNNVMKIGYHAFDGCGKLESIFYTGTMAQWGKINLGAYWNNNCPAQVVHCTDGKVEL